MNFYDIDLVTIEGKPQKMDVDRGKTLLIVNRRTVDACKGESATVDEFLTSAITKELKSWE